MFSRNELKQQRQRASLNKSTFPTSMCCDKTEYTNPRKYCVLQFHRFVWHCDTKHIQLCVNMCIF